MEINKKYKNKPLIAWDPEIEGFAIVSPQVFTSTIYTEDGKSLDEVLKITPSEVIDQVNAIIAGAPKAYDSFLEVSKALEQNKNSITEILNAIGSKIQMPGDGQEGHVLKLDKDGKPVWATDENTVYEHPPTHDPTIIKETDYKQFVSAQNKTNWDKKQEVDGSLNNNEITINGATSLLVTFLTNFLQAYTDLANSKGKENGLATLDGVGKVQSSQLPDLIGDLDTTILSHFKEAEIVYEADNLTINLKRQNDAVFPLKINGATALSAGLMTAKDKEKIDNATIVKSMTQAEYTALQNEGQVQDGILYLTG